MIARSRAVVSALFVLLFAPVLTAQENPSLDVRLFRSINNQQTVEDGVIEFIDDSSIQLFIAIPVGALLFGVFGDDRSVFDTGVLLAVSQSVTWGTTEIGKALTGRQRPFEALRDVKLKHQASARGSSFPSGHTAQAFAIATMIALRSKPAVYIPTLLWATFIGYGRMYVGVHYPTDILGGIVVGAVLSAVVYHYRNDILFKDEGTYTPPTPLSQASVPLVSITIPFR